MNRHLLMAVVILAGVLIFAGLVQARTAEDLISVRFADIQLIVDDEVVLTQAEPFIYEGNVYAPVATVANMLDIGQSWDNDVPAVRFTRDEIPSLGYWDPAHEHDLGDGVKLTVHAKYGYVYLWQLTGGIWEHQALSFGAPDGYVAISHAGPELLTSESTDVSAPSARELIWVEPVLRENGDVGVLLRLLRWDEKHLHSVGWVVDEDSFSSRTDSTFVPEHNQVMVRYLSADGTIEGLRFYQFTKDNWQTGTRFD